MSYISVLRCVEGVVLVADTQETIEDQKQYCEKLTVSQKYPVAVGGAGVDDITDAFSQEVIERIESSRPGTDEELGAIIRAALRYVYENDVPVSVIKKQYRTAAFIVAAKAGERVAIFRVLGKRVYPVKNRVIIGYATAPNNVLLERLYRESLSMHQAVLLATYLVSQSKKLDEAVGGETQIALVTPQVAKLDNPTHIENVESRAKEFLRLMDDFFIVCADLTSRENAFAEQLKIYSEKFLRLRNEHKRRTAEWYFSDPERIAKADDPYPYLAAGFLLEVGVNGATFSEDENKLAQMRRMIALVEPEAQKLRDAQNRQSEEKNNLKDKKLGS